MSTEMVAAEIGRFLTSSEPEVLCIKGKWGVGKTFAWRKYLSDAQKAGSCKHSHYSYVSLFGLNSLDDLRYAIVEGTVTPDHALTGPNVDTLNALLKKGFGQARPILDTALAFLGRKDGGAALAKAAFLLVRNQLVCLDDLERAGDGLKQRDVLGLASALKEQRNCKVVLLLNDEEMDAKEREEFERQLEKVVDVALVFDPAPSEAAAIALPGTDRSSELLCARVTQLGIVNIRVIKKIERLTKRLQEILVGCGEPIQEQAIAAVSLGAWAVFEPGKAPTLDFLKTYNDITFRMRNKREAPEQEAEVEEEWKARMRDYPFVYADDLDILIFDGVKRGFFDAVAVLDAAKALEASLAAEQRNNSFTSAWDLYHGSLNMDDDEVLDAIFVGAMECMISISPSSLNSTIVLFRELGREDQANEMLAAYVDAHPDDLSSQPFMAGEAIDPPLRAALEAHFASIIDERDPKDVLIKVADAQSWDEADVTLLARLEPGELVAMFEEIAGREVGRAIRQALRLGRQPDASGIQLGKNLEVALKLIAAKSPMRARRLKQLGVDL